MSTVGLNFGSATSGTGFDVASTVTAIQASQKSIENPWNTQLTALTAQDTALSSIGTDLSSLTTALQALTDFTGVTAQKNGSSSNTALLALTGATSSAVAGSHTVVINTLAQTSSDISAVVGNSADVLSGSLQIQVGSGTTHTITIDSTSNTLASLSSAINGADIGVTASVVSDVNGSRLSIVSKTSGSAGQLTVTSNVTDTSPSATNSSITFTNGSNGTEGQQGVNASLQVDGVNVTSASNTVSTAIPGVTFQLLSAAQGTQIQVQITNDTASVSTAVSTFVTAYNKVAKDLKTQEGKDSSGNAEPLYGSPILASIQTQLSTSIAAGTASGSVHYLSDLGVNFNQDGTLTLNTDTLTTSLTNHFSDVVGFLQNSGSFGQSFKTALNGLGTQAPYGTLYVTQQQNSNQETALKKDISDEDALLAAQKVTLTAELNTANQELQAIPSQLNQISEIYSAVTGYNKSTN